MATSGSPLHLIHPLTNNAPPTLYHQIKYSVIIGEPSNNIGDSIIELATSEKADMIVMGNRALGAVERFWMGSVTGRVLEMSTVPVFVCPEKEGKK